MGGYPGANSPTRLRLHRAAVTSAPHRAALKKDGGPTQDFQPDIPTACREDAGLAQGINIERGKVTNRAVADAFELEFAPLSLTC